MTAYESTWPDPALTDAEEQRICEWLAEHRPEFPDPQERPLIEREQRARRVAGLRPLSPFAAELPVRIVVTSPVETAEQIESRTYAGAGSRIPPHVDAWLTERYSDEKRESAWHDTRVDMTAPGCTDVAAKAAPGPQLNLPPRAHRSLVSRLVRRLLKGL